MAARQSRLGRPLHGAERGGLALADTPEQQAPLSSGSGRLSGPALRLLSLSPQTCSFIPHPLPLRSVSLGAQL